MFNILNHGEIKGKFHRSTTIEKIPSSSKISNFSIRIKI